MGKHALLFVATALVLASPWRAAAQGTPSPAKPPARGAVGAEAVNRIAGYTAWDDEFLYIAVQVNKPTVAAKNVEPFSHPLDDDATIISIQADDDHKSTTRTAKSFVLAVSAAGGFQLYSGAAGTPLFTSLQAFNDQFNEIIKTEKDPATQQKKLLDLQSRVVKVKVVPKGADRPGGGAAPGYTLEVAVPWTDLGGKPAAGARMGLNIVAQSKAPGSPTLQSLTTTVKGLSDVDNPSLWGHLVLSNAPAATTPESLTAPRVFTQKPVIDGDVTTIEWNNLSLFAFGEASANVQGAVVLETVRAARSRLEIALHAPRPVVPIAAGGPLPSVKAHSPQSVTPLVMARWEYWYQADTRKAAPALHVTRSDQSSLMAHHPLEGTGPWFSFDHADWQRRQLMDMRQAGVDVVLPLYRGAARDRQLYSDKGLTVLASALQSLRQNGLEYPEVGLFLDTDALIQTFGDRPDLRQPTVQSALYDIIRNFYRRIPAEFRCSVQLSAENGGLRACPVVLSDSHSFTALNGDFAPYLRARFQRDFGCDLVLIGGPGFKGNVALDGYFAPTQDQTLTFDENGWLKVAALSPGFDSILLPDLPAKMTQRRDDQYRAALTAALARHPSLVLLDGWNDYTMGREIAPSLEVGYSALDLTRVFVRSLASSGKLGVKFLAHDIPGRMASGARFAVHLRAENTGLTAWGPAPAGSPTSFRVRWVKGGTAAAESSGAQPADLVLPGQCTTLAITVPAVDRSGAPLAEGDYLLQIVPAAGADTRNPRDADQAGELSVPVHIGGAPAWAGTVTRSEMPMMMESGSGYIVDATLRNDGERTWRKGERVTLRLYRTTSGSPDAPDMVETPVAAADASAVLGQDVPPGQEAQAHLLLPTVDPDGKPLPFWKQDELWTYTARWEVAPDQTAGVRPVSDTPDRPEGFSFAPVAVVIDDFDFGVRFTPDRMPLSLPADRKQPVSLTIQNAGPETWKRDQVRIGYHWYYLDGTELRWEDALTAIPQDVPPGGRVNDLLVNVSAPPTDGSYFLVWDVKFGDMWASTSAVTHVFDSVVHPIQVVGSRLIFADLAKAYNVNGVSDGGRQSGDFDGKGNAFPAAFLPPYTDSPVTPAAMWLPSDQGGPESVRRISFRWGPKDGQLNNFIACRGQRVELGKSSGQCRLLHLVAASTDKDVTATLKLIFQEPTSQSEDQYAVTVSRWDSPPTHGEEVALVARRHYEGQQVKPGAVALYHYVIKVREPRKLVAISLPNAPEIKIAAITLEK